MIKTNQDILGEQCIRNSLPQGDAVSGPYRLIEKGMFRESMQNRKAIGILRLVSGMVKSAGEVGVDIVKYLVKQRSQQQLFWQNFQLLLREKERLQTEETTKD